MRVNHLVQCSTSQTHTFICARSSGVLITLCQPYYHQLSLWAPRLDDSVLTIVLQPIIFQIPGLESWLTVGSSLESWNCLLTSYPTSFPCCITLFPPLFHRPPSTCLSFSSPLLFPPLGLDEPSWHQRTSSDCWAKQAHTLCTCVKGNTSLLIQSVAMISRTVLPWSCGSLAYFLSSTSFHS